jgi:diguanylate cyclase (GGDEF)-like protein
VLALVALLPLIGLASLSALAISDASHRAADLAEVDREVDRVNEVFALAADLTTEQWWATASVVVVEFAPLDVIAELVDIDLEDEYRAAEAAVDERLALLDMPDARARLADVRSEAQADGATMGVVADRYGELLEELEGWATVRLSEISSLAAQANDSGRIDNAIDVLALTNVLRNETSMLTSTLFGLGFGSPRGLAEDARLLVESETIYHTTLERLEAIADPVLAAEIDDVNGTASVGALHERTERTAAAILADGAPTEVPAADLASLDLEAEKEVFLAGIGALTRHVELVDAAAVSAATIVGETKQAAIADRNAVLALVTAVSIFSLVGMFVAGRWIVGPLRRMAEAADAMREGELGAHALVAGPKEVRSAAAALNEAAEQLKLAEGQALALAEEDLSHPVLAARAPGALGASLRTAVAHLADSLAEREQYRQRLAHESAHDGLTGLANRAASLNELGSALARVRRSGSDLAVLFIDLDEFKPVNDRLGHAAGDRVLGAVAQRISAAVREGDHVGRLGGDEFVVIAEPVADLDEAVLIAQRILGEIARPVSVGTTQITPGASIGIALGCSADLSADEIIRDADLAVYQAKTLGRGRIEICDAELRQSLAHRATIETKLRKAIAANELVLHYQTVTEAHTGLPVSLEALVRWVLPDGTLVPPNDFIPIAERSDLILDVDRWVLDRAAAQMAIWKDHPQLGRLPIAVNISARHLCAPTLMSDVLGALARHDVSPSRLILEITESALLGDLDRAARRLAELRSRGIKVAIDDFGTGYTSLAHLRRLPVDVLKIDRSFVSNLDRTDDRSLVKLIVETGHLLGVSVTAEGVETYEQADLLADLGSDHLQGYRFSRPVSPLDVESSMRDLVGG